MLALFLLPLSLTNVFLVVTATLLVYLLGEGKKNQKKHIKDGLLEPPTPRKLPIVGHLHLLGGYEIPYQAFSELGKKYGSVINLQLGNVKCVAINGQKNIREALVTKGHHFDSRPNFQRYQELFSGNKENSLAFCDWSDTQKVRRDMLKTHTFPRAFTHKFLSLETIIQNGTETLISKIQPQTVTDLKPLVLRSCANMFLNHFCTKTFDENDEKFVTMVEDLDEIFYEVNQGHAADFLPFLMPLHRKNLERMNTLTRRIREFIEEEVIGDRYESFDLENSPDDYVESLVEYVKAGKSPELPWDTALFALEDIIGGHSAVGNFLIKMFGFLVKEQDVQKKIQEEIEEKIGNERTVTISDRTLLPYTESVIFEAIRLIASPIVPRVANRDSSIDGYRIEKGSLLFLNNYDLSMSEKLWDEPEKFKPERFVKDGKFVKPEHFLPFGGGRRSCMGYKMVLLISFGILGGILQKFTITPAQDETYKIPIGSLALKKETFKFNFVNK